MSLERYAKHLQNESFFDDHILCFVHIPKTAGTSFSNILKWTIGSKNYKRITLEMADGSSPLNFEMDAFRAISGHLPYEVCKLLRKKPILLTFLREPISRTISQFHQYKRSGREAPFFKRYPDMYESFKDLDLDGYIKHPYFGKALSNPQTRYIGLHISSPKNINELSMTLRKKQNPETRSISVQLAKERLEQIAFLGIQDQFQESMDIFSYQFGTYQATTHPLLNKTYDGIQKEGLPKSTIDHIRKINLLDIELYEFGRKIFNQRYDEMKEEFSKQTSSHQSITLQDWIRAESWPSQDKTRNVRFKFETLQSTSGWHDTDYTAGGESWTWSGPGTESAIDFPLDRAVGLKVEILIENFMAPDILKGLKMEIDGSPLAVEHSTKGRKQVVSAIIPPDHDKPAFTYTNMKFLINRTIRPCDVNPLSDDKRSLGIAIKSIEITQV